MAKRRLTLGDALLIALGLGLLPSPLAAPTVVHLAQHSGAGYDRLQTTPPPAR